MNVRKRLLLLPGAFLCASVAMAQSGVDNSTSTGVFQMEGDATKTANICYLTLANGGPAIATPNAPGSSSLDTVGCPTLNPAGATKTWNLITFGSGGTNNTDDWSSYVFSNGPPPHFVGGGHALFPPAFVADPVSLKESSFLGASTKDTDDIPAWTWNAAHNVQDKDDIFHAFAAAYKLANGDTAIYAGMDRFGNSGDSTAGFWFVQDSTFAMCTGVGTDTNGSNTACKAAGTFVGKHFDGDLLIVSDFSIGGAVSTINIFTWQGSNLVFDGGRSPAPCDPLNGGSDLCGQVNNAFIQAISKGKLTLVPALVSTGGWGFSDKGGFSAYQTGEFLEIAVDLNKIFGANIPCFSTFFAETRSSTSTGATLSDLTPPVSFPLCSLSATKFCTTSQLVSGGPSVDYSFGGRITNSGSSTIYNVTITDAPTTACPDCGPPSGVTMLSITCTGCKASGGIPPAGNSQNLPNYVDYTGSFRAAGVLGTNQVNKIVVTASSSSTGSPLNVDGVATSNDFSTCGPPIHPGLTVAKKCESCLSQTNSTSPLVIQVKEAVKVCNTGNDNITSINVEDCRGTPGPASGQGAQAYSDIENDATCSVPFVTLTLDAGTTLNAASGCDSNGLNCTTPTCGIAAQNETPLLAQCTQFVGGTPPSGGNCSFSDMVFVHGTATLSGSITGSNSTACSLCPINTTCPTITFP